MFIERGPTVAKAPDRNMSDSQGRKRGDQKGLETLVVLTVKAAFQKIFLQGCLSLVILFSLHGDIIYFNIF